MTSVQQKEVILAGDIGGTKTNLGLFKKSAQRPKMTAFQSYPSREYSGLEEIIDTFLHGRSISISRACFGIAGPVASGTSKATNLPWMVTEKSLARRFGWSNIRLVNDLTATAMAIPLLSRREFLSLNRAKARNGAPLALLAPGTGLGQALMICVNNRYIPVPSEGGHMDFAPNSEEEVELWRYLHKRFGHVSLERVLSGPGLVNIYCWLKDSKRFKEPAWLARKMADSDPARNITEAALNRKTPLCIAVLRIFTSMLGAAAGNIALIGMATGGVYLSGGIPQKIIPFLKEGAFMAAFTHKGRFKAFMTKIPVRVILNEKAALLGAACGAVKYASVCRA